MVTAAAVTSQTTMQGMLQQQAGLQVLLRNP
jgi:hypothetical protein